MSAEAQAFGLRVRSDVRLPGAVQEAEILSPDVVIDTEFCRANVGNKPRPCTHSVERELGPYGLTADTLIFTMPGLARFHCRRDGSTILIEPASTAASEPDLAEGLAAYLQATALPALLWLRGAIVLHCAAAVLPGSHFAIALAGPSGAGKSTLLRRLIAVGGGVVTDDCLALRMGEASGLPAATQLRLADGSRIQRAVPRDQQILNAPLRVLIELGEASFEPQTVSGAEALALLLRNLHRPRVPQILGLNRTLLPQLAALAGQIRVYRWSAEAALGCSPAQLAEHLQRL